MVAEGGEDGHDHHGEQAAGEAHVVEVHAVLDFIGIGGQGGQHEADDDAGQNAQRDAGVDAAQGHVAHQRGKGRGQQAHRGVFGEGLLLVSGIQPGAQNDGPDVQHVFAEQGKARHQTHLHHGKAVEGVPGELDDEDGDDGHKAGVDQGGADSGDVHIVGDEQVLHGDDAVKPRQDVGGVVQRDAQEHQQDGGRDGAGKYFFVAVMQGVPSL